LCLTSTEAIRLIEGGGVMEIIYLYTYPYTVTTRMTFCIKVGGDESQF